jgi:hypothetical protein
MNRSFAKSGRRALRSSAWQIVASGWVVAGALAALGLAGMSACEADGVTPDCPLDGGTCLTPPGDAYPVNSDAGTD